MATSCFQKSTIGCSKWERVATRPSKNGSVTKSRLAGYQAEKGGARPYQSKEKGGTGIADRLGSTASEVLKTNAT